MKVLSSTSSLKDCPYTCTPPLTFKPKLIGSDTESEIIQIEEGRRLSKDLLRPNSFFLTSNGRKDCYSVETDV